MNQDRNTRYFLFAGGARVNYGRMLLFFKLIDAFAGYKVVVRKGKAQLRGFIVLRGRPTVAEDLQRLFPWFQIVAVPHSFEVEFESIPSVVITTKGEHPFKDIRVNLFKHKDEELASCV